MSDLTPLRLLWSSQVWDLREGQLFYTLHGHEGATLAGAFSPAGDYFASAGADEQVCETQRVLGGECVCMNRGGGSMPVRVPNVWVGGDPV